MQVNNLKNPCPPPPCRKLPSPHSSILLPTTHASERSEKIMYNNLRCVSLTSKLSQLLWKDRQSLKYLFYVIPPPSGWFHRVMSRFNRSALLLEATHPPPPLLLAALGHLSSSWFSKTFIDHATHRPTAPAVCYPYIQKRVLLLSWLLGWVRVVPYFKEQKESTRIRDLFGSWFT